MSNRGRHHKKKKDWIYDVLSQSEINWLLEGQRWAGNPPNIEVFKKDPYTPTHHGGFNFLIYDEHKNVPFDHTMSITDKIQEYKRLTLEMLNNIRK